MSEIDATPSTNSRWTTVQRASIERGVDKMRLNGDDDRMSSREYRGRNNRGPPPEPQMNSRAAAFGDAPSYRSQQYRRDEERRDRRSNAPPPSVANSRFSRLAEDDNRDSYRENNSSERRDRDSYRSRGPPPQQTSSRFAMAAKEFESERELDPPPRAAPKIQNSRFSAAARQFENEREEYETARAARPPPPRVQTNSRFALAAAADEEDRRAYEAERQARQREREERFGSRNNDYSDRGSEGPPPRGNNRWGNVERDSLGGGGGFNDRGGGGRYNDRFSNNRRGGGGFDDNEPHLPRFPGDRGPGRRSNRFDNSEPSLPRFPGDNGQSSSSSVVNKALLPKKKVEKVILPPVSAPLALPGEDEEAARARIEKKKADEAERKKREEEEAARLLREKEEAERKAAEAAQKALEAEDDILAEFGSGKLLGDELAAWCKEKSDANLLPSVEKLVFFYLREKENNNPDSDCKWAAKPQYGAALLSLVEDDVLRQTEVLWAIQRYCDWMGFPKKGTTNEYLVQSMFMAMYKYDLAEAEAYDYWKEDESDEHEVGKQKTLVQTIDWFNWLEEDDEEEYEDEEYEY